MGQFQVGKWILGFVGSLLVAGGLGAAVIFFVEPRVGRWTPAVAVALASGVGSFCAAWVQQRYGRRTR